MRAFYPYWETKAELKVFCEIVKFNPTTKKYSCGFCTNVFITEAGANHHVKVIHRREVKEKISEV